jgi:glycosyltransferase involved in cell wall biosynthesis
MINEENGKQNREVHDDNVRGCMVSVSCITFNHAGYIRQALDSFLMQKTDFAYEILIHDDASTDGTIDIIKEYEERYPDIIRPVLETENQYSKGISNISGVFNFPRARGRYIAMCEGDDYWSDPYKLQKQFDLMESDAGYSLCCHSAGVIYENEAFGGETLIRPFKGSGEIRPEEMISKRTNIPTASMFFRTEYAKSLPDWYFDCPVGDIPLQLYLVLKGRIYYIDEPMSVYRSGSAGSWQDSMDKDESRLIAKWEAHYSAMEKLYKAFDAESEGKWRESVDEALRRQRFHIDLKEGKASAVKDSSNRLFVSELPASEARLQRIKADLPWLYELMRRAYKLIKR